MLYYVSLEPYNSRYTLQLTDWNVETFNERGICYTIVDGQKLTDSIDISVGEVLDAHGRSYYALSQMMELVKLHQQGKITKEDTIFFEDMFHPGIEALPYIFNQCNEELKPKVWVRCLAQTVDPDDFVHYTGMYNWMKRYEQLVNEFVTGIMATNEEMVANMKIAGWKAPIYNISGLAFSKNEIYSRLSEEHYNIPYFDDRPRRVVFTSRWANEKQPLFFLELVQKCIENKDDIQFEILSGKKIKHPSKHIEDVIKSIQENAPGYLTLKEDLPKNVYYKTVANSRIVFNCALQDWTSNTVSEGDALGANVVFPAYRSFPEVFTNDASRLYIPWSVDDAYAKIKQNIESIHPRQGDISNWNSMTIHRELTIMLAPDDAYRAKFDRNSIDYRKHLTSIL